MLWVHSAALLFGAAGLFGKFLPLDPWTIVWGRCLFGCLGLASFFVLRRQRPGRMERRQVLWMVGIGGILALHWGTFFAAIQVSTVAIGLMAFATYPVFVSLIEPLVFPGTFGLRRLAWATLAMGAVAAMGLEGNAGSDTGLGVGLGALSAFLFACLTVANRRWVQSTNPWSMVFWQLLFAAMWLSPWVSGDIFKLNISQSLALVALGVVFTAVAHTLYTIGMRSITAQSASLIVCLEPVYGSGLALITLGENPSRRTLICGAVIVLVSVLSGWGGIPSAKSPSSRSFNT